LAFLKEKWFKFLDTCHRLGFGNIGLSLITLFFLTLIIILPTFLIGKYKDPGFLDNVLVEANGMVLDLLIFGVFISWLSNRQEKKRQIQFYMNEIDDFRNWPEQTAAHRIRGNIIRLNKMGISKIDLSNCYLENAKLENVKLVDSDLWKTNLSNCDLDNSDLQGSDLWNSNLTGAVLRNARLEKASLVNAKLINSNLSDSNLKGAILSYSDLLEANYSNAILDDADLTEVKSLDPIQLSKVKSAANLIIDKKLFDQAKRHNPHL
jgi:BTB/POZ domain-containing protein KCTD9